MSLCNRADWSKIAKRTNQTYGLEPSVKEEIDSFNAMYSPRMYKRNVKPE